MTTLIDHPHSALAVPSPAELLRTYAKRTPRDLEESLHAAMASYEHTFGKHFVVPFVRTLRAGVMRHFDIAEASTGVVDAERLWSQSVVDLVRQTGAEVLTVATHGGVSTDELLPSERLPRQHLGLVQVQALDGAGRHLSATCLVDLKPRWVERQGDWLAHEVGDLNLEGFDNDPAPALAALAAVAAERSVRAPWQRPVR